MVNRQRCASKEAVGPCTVERVLAGLRTKLDSGQSNSVKKCVVGVGMMTGRVTTVANRSDMKRPVHRLGEAVQRKAAGHETLWRWTADPLSLVAEIAVVVDVPRSAWPQHGHPGFAPGEIPSVRSRVRLKKIRSIFTYTITSPSRRIDNRVFVYLNAENVAQGSIVRKKIGSPFTGLARRRNNKK